MPPTNEYVVVRKVGYYVAGTRMGLDSVTCDFRRGRSAEGIFEAYVKDQDRIVEEIKARYPMPRDMVARFQRAKKDAAPKLA